MTDLLDLLDSTIQEIWEQKTREKTWVVPVVPVPKNATGTVKLLENKDDPVVQHHLTTGIRNLRLYVLRKKGGAL